MVSLRPLFTSFISLLLIHLGCFLIFPSNHHHQSKKRKPSYLSLDHVSPSKLKPHKPLSSSWTFLKRIFSSNPNTTTIPSPASTTRSFHQQSALISPEPLVSDPPRIRQTGSHPEPGSLRNDICPCPNCGEIFQNPNLLQQHQSFKHAVSELVNDGSGNFNIVRIIFQTGWPGKGKSPNIHRVLKIHNCPKIVARFEEYRESVKSRAARNGAVRCIADGNELLRFHCATFLCELGGQNGNSSSSSSICNNKYCSVCGIIRSGFSAKMDGISTRSTSWKAHAAVPEEIEEEFKFMHVKRAMLVCRVIAGRVGCDPDVVDKDDPPGYDSLVGRVHSRLDEDDELSVFNPKALLPCFVIVYTV